MQTVLDIAHNLSLRLGSQWLADSSSGPGVPVEMLEMLNSLRAMREEDFALLDQLYRTAHPTTELRQRIQSSAARFVQLALPGVRRLAVALQTLWQQQTERQQQRQAELARAAASRPGCSYLRCAEVQGGRSKRCSGCRVTRYCSVACQHADWRQGGHRQMCRLLGAAGEEQDAT